MGVRISEKENVSGVYIGKDDLLNKLSEACKLKQCDAIFNHFHQAGKNGKVLMISGATKNVGEINNGRVVGKICRYLAYILGEICGYLAYILGKFCGYLAYILPPQSCF